MPFLNSVNQFSTHSINNEQVPPSNSSVKSDTIIALAVSALSLIGAGFFQYTAPEFSGVLLAVPVLSFAVWLIRRVGSRTSNGYHYARNIHVDQTPHFQPQQNYSRWSSWNPIRFFNPNQNNYRHPQTNGLYVYENTSPNRGEINIQSGQNFQNGSSFQHGQSINSNGMNTLPMNRAINIQTHRNGNEQSNNLNTNRVNHDPLIPLSHNR